MVKKRRVVRFGEEDDDDPDEEENAGIFADGDEEPDAFDMMLLDSEKPAPKLSQMVGESADFANESPVVTVRSIPDIPNHDVLESRVSPTPNVPKMLEPHIDRVRSGRLIDYVGAISEGDQGFNQHLRDNLTDSELDYLGVCLDRSLSRKDVEKGERPLIGLKKSDSLRTYDRLLRVVRQYYGLYLRRLSRNKKGGVAES